MTMSESVDCDINALNSTDLNGGVSPSLWASLCRVIKTSLLPEQIYAEERPSEEADFDSFKKEVLPRINSVWSFISKFVTSAPTYNFDRDSLVWTLILCGEHHSSELWTTDETQRQSVLCVQALCSFYDCSSVSQLLLGKSHNLSPCFKQALVLLRPKLLQNTWRKHPGAVSSYKWLLLQLRTPNLSEYLDIVSPTALIMLDDHDAGRRLLGLQCMAHIIINVARTELVQRGLHQVFYKTLEPMLWQRTASQIEPAVTCLTNLLSMTERGYTRSSEPGMWDLFDDTLSTLLDKMIFEDQIPLRLAYIKCLGPLISAMGHPVIRWSKPLLAVLDEYLHKDSFDTRRHALEVLKIYISLSAPRLIHNGDNILGLLLRVCYDISSESSTSNELKLVKDCVTLIKPSVTKEYQNIINELKDLPCSEAVKNVIVTTFEV